MHSMNDSSKAIATLLVSKGKEIFDAAPKFIRFTKDDAADELMNNLDEYPHAFVLGCLMDKQMKAELAWIAPYKISQKLGDFHFSTLEKLTLSDIIQLMSHPKPLHRFPEKMSSEIYNAIKDIRHKYDGIASQIWANNPSSAKVVYEFLQFDGIGLKIATMAANILARELKVTFSDNYSIDISVDVHVRRVFTRLGLIKKDATVDEVIYRARALHPEFPGLMDLPAWNIGRSWCKPNQPICSDCYISSLCPSKGTS